MFNDLPDGVKAHIRTYWPIALGYLATILVVPLAAKLGIEISGETAFLFTGAVMSGVVYSAGWWLERRRLPAARWLGRLLLSFGAELGKPTYDPPHARPTMTAPRRRTEL